MNKRILSVMIPMTPRRIVECMDLIAELNRQMIPKVTELIYLGDNETLPIGDNINRMVQAASGEFVTVVGDDDWVSRDYVESIVQAARECPSADVICFDTQHWDGPKLRGIIKCGKNYESKQDTPGEVLYRNASDTMAWKRDIRLAVPAVPTWESHDSVFARQANAMIHVESRIDKALYIHRWNSSNEYGKRYREKLDREYQESQ